MATNNAWHSLLVETNLIIQISEHVFIFRLVGGIKLNVFIMTVINNY